MYLFEPPKKFKNKEMKKPDIVVDSMIRFP